MLKRANWLMGLVLWIACALTSTAAVSFELLGVLPREASDVTKPETKGYGISSDGSVIVGGNFYVNLEDAEVYEAFRWEDGVLSDLGTLPGGALLTQAEAVSGDGSVVVGMSLPGGSAFVWQNGAVSALAADRATDISSDGTIISGERRVGNAREAGTWVNNVFVSVGPKGSYASTFANGISSDGQVVVGFGETTAQTALRWTNQQLTGLENSAGDSRAHDASGDGSVIVGTWNDEAFYWTGGVLTSLESLPNTCCGSEALSVSDDGRLIVGYSYRSEGRETAVMWLEDNGYAIVDLNAFLDANNVDRGGWYLEQATAVSADGTTLTGWARFDADGHTEAFRLRLDAGETWGGFAVHSDGQSVNTQDFLGWIDVMSTPWVWVYSLESYVYLPEESVGESGSWIYVPSY